MDIQYWTTPSLAQRRGLMAAQALIKRTWQRNVSDSQVPVQVKVQAQITNPIEQICSQKIKAKLAGDASSL